MKNKKRIITISLYIDEDRVVTDYECLGDVFKKYHEAILYADRILTVPFFRYMKRIKAIEKNSKIGSVHFFDSLSKEL